MRTWGNFFAAGLLAAVASAGAAICAPGAFAASDNGHHNANFSGGKAEPSSGKGLWTSLDIGGGTSRDPGYSSISSHAGSYGPSSFNSVTYSELYDTNANRHTSFNFGGSWDQSDFHHGDKYGWKPNIKKFETLTNKPDVSPVVTPIPAALPLFASGIGAMGLVAWRNRRKVRLSRAA